MAASKQAPGGSTHRSTVIASLLVAAAGVVTYFGYQPAQAGLSDGPAHTETVTLAAESPAREEFTASPRGLPTRVRIESAGIDTSVAEVGIVLDGSQARWQTAWRSAGHHIDSSRPGNPGNVVLTGHVSVSNAANVPVFANLDLVTVGDLIEVFSGTARHVYQVEEVEVVGPDEIGVLENDHRSLVTLITCTRDLEHRLVVVGALVS